MYTLEELQIKVKQYFSEENFIKTPRGLYEPIDYTLALGGKRIRPIMLLAATDMFGGNIEESRYAAIAIETFHNFTLLHDDLMDKSPVRRGKPTVYRKWDENTAILSGDAMHILAWHYLLKQKHNNLYHILRTFEKTSLEIHEGQQYDMDFENRNDVTIAEYMNMIRLKTAVLLAAALKIGALYTDATTIDINLLYEFGISLGLAFQLRDDLLDVYGDITTFGKQTGTDIKDNKKTYLMLKALEKADLKTKAQLIQLFSTKPENPNVKITEVTEIYDKLEIRTDVENEISKLHENAIDKLNCINRPQQTKKCLQDLAQKLLEREV